MLLHTDTDSLQTIIKTEGIYKDKNDDIKYIDSTNFDENTDKPITANKNRKVPLLDRICIFHYQMEDEYAEDPIVKFVGISSKTYTQKHAHDKNTTKAKDEKNKKWIQIRLFLKKQLKVQNQTK